MPRINNGAEEGKPYNLGLFVGVTTILTSRPLVVYVHVTGFSPA